jgi:drug/metabolite transporter (DMT)-like permease
VSWRGWLAFAGLSVIWGLPYFFIKVAVQEVPPFVVAFFRVALATAVLFPLAWRRGALISIWRYKGAVIAFAMVEFAVPFATISVGERWISSSVTGILIAMVPLSIALIQRFFGISEPLGRWRIVGLALGFIGVAALVGTGPITWPLGWAGVACMLVATVGYAIGPLIIQRHMSGLDSLGPLTASLGVATAVLAIPAALQMPDRWPSANAILSIVMLGILCTAVAMLLLFYLVRDAGASRATVITYINPVVATLLGVVVLHESLGVGGAIAFAMILLGSWLATRGRRQGARLTI